MPLLALLCAGTLAAAGMLAVVVAQAEHLRPDVTFAWSEAVVGLVLSVGAGAAAARRVLRARRREPRRAASLAPFRGMTVVAIATWGLYLAFAPPFRLLHLGVALALGFGAFALLFLVVPPVTARLPGRAVRAADFALFNLALLPLLAEGTLRVYALWRPSPLFAQPDQTDTARIERFRNPGEMRLGFPNNAQGHYDTAVPLEPRKESLAVFLGDSFSQGVVPHHYHFTTVLERALPGLEAYNVGFVGIGPPEYLRLLRSEALPLRPDLVVVDLFVGNDLHFRGPEHRPHRLLRLWFDRENLLLSLVPARLARLEAEREALGEITFRSASTRGRIRVEELPERMPWLEDPLLEQPGYSEERFLAIEVERATALCRPGVTDFGPAFEVLEELIVAAGDTPLAFVLIPDEFQVEEPLWEAVLAEIPERPLERFHPQDVVQRWLEERGIPTLDLLPILRDQEPLEDGRRHLYHFRDTHFNARGSRVVGEALAGFVGALL